MIFIVFRRLLRMKRRGRKQPSPHKQVKQFQEEVRQMGPRVATPLVDAPPEIARWHAELLDTARQLEADIHTRIATLQAVTRAADAQANRLERLLAESRATAAASSSPAQSESESDSGRNHAA